VHLAVHADAGATAEALLASSTGGISNRGRTAHRHCAKADGGRLKSQRALPGRFDSGLHRCEDSEQGGGRDPAEAAGLWRLTPVIFALVPQYLRVPNARASCLSHSFQSVGLGLASAIVSQ